MAAPSRSALIAKAHKILRKHYPKVEAPDGSRPLLEELLYGCCLENSSSAAAEKTYQTVKKSFFDWNEVRVTSVPELAELMRDVYDPRAAAMHLKRVLQSVFETTYSFDLESFKKKPIGQAVKDLGKLQGATPFAIDHVTQLSLGGHAVPIDKGTLDALVILGIVTPKEAETGKVPGLERNVSKNKGKEFAALLHQLGADLLAKPYSQDVRELLLSIAPDCKERLPKRPTKKQEEEAAKAAALAAQAKAGKSTDGKGKPAIGDKKADAKSATAGAEKDAKKKPAAGEPINRESVSRASKKEPTPAKKHEAAAPSAKPRVEAARSAKGLAKSKPR
jgi:endonuclease-3